eukprot:1916152-Rhodomonas_salina.3
MPASVQIYLRLSTRSWYKKPPLQVCGTRIPLSVPAYQQRGTTSVRTVPGEINHAPGPLGTPHVGGHSALNSL